MRASNLLVVLTTLTLVGQSVRSGRVVVFPAFLFSFLFVFPPFCFLLFLSFPSFCFLFFWFVFAFACFPLDSIEWLKYDKLYWIAHKLEHTIHLNLAIRHPIGCAAQHRNAHNRSHAQAVLTESRACCSDRPMDIFSAVVNPWMYAA